MSKDFEDIDLEMEEEKPKPTIKSKTPASKKEPVMSKTPVSTGSGAKKNIFFKSTVGPEKSEKLSVGENTPVGDVKQTLANIFGLTPDDFHLSHAGRTMDENSKLGDYGVDNGDEILLIPHSTAG